jgi:hypothetical protein
MWHHDETKPVLFTGGLGSGKTEIAVNYSLKMARKDRPVHLIDLDIIKPYFRSRQLIDELKDTGVILVAPPAPYLYADLPLIPPEVGSLIKQPSKRVVIDVGGDDAGARVLGCYQEDLEKRKYQFYYVINISRPYAGTVEDVKNMAIAIEGACGLKITGIINNTHLLWETTPEMVKEGALFSAKVAQELSVPLIFHGIREGLEGKETLHFKEPLFPMKLFFYRRF